MCSKCPKSAINTNEVDYLALLAERNSLAAIHRVKRVKEETLVAWLRVAAQHVERIEAILLANYRLTRAQLDAMWTSVGHKGQKGAPGAGRPRHLLARHNPRYRYAPARGAPGRQDRGRGRPRFDGSTQRSGPSRCAAGHGDRWERRLSRGTGRGLGAPTRIQWRGPTSNPQAPAEGVAIAPGRQDPIGQSPDRGHNQGDLG
jgi:hypothetical protein